MSKIERKIKESEIIYDKGFKGEEVANASDILDGGGTAIKPSDLQIEYPANHSSGKNPSEIIQEESLKEINTLLKS